MSDIQVRAHAPGRVNLVGDHVDYLGGQCVPMAVQLGTTVMGRRTGDRVVLRSRQLEGDCVVPLDVDEPADVEPAWARYVAGVVDAVSPAVGFIGVVDSTVPVGHGLSSSAALEVAVALALGFAGTPRELAAACRRGEERAGGTPCGPMDQLAAAMGRRGHALFIECAAPTVTPVPMPPDVEVVVVDSGQARGLVATGYAERRRQAEAAQSVVGRPLPEATPGDADAIDDPVLRRRARHVVRECALARAFAAALAAGDVAVAGEIMAASHASLRDDAEVSTPAVDELVADLLRRPGVLGARLTGGGFGGSVVALARPGALATGTVVEASAGASVSES